MIDSYSFLTQILNGLVRLYPDVVWLVKHFVGLVIGLSFPVALFLFIAIVYTVEQLKRVRAKEEQIYDLKVEPAYEKDDPKSAALAHRWQSVLTHMDSANPNDWKQAVIEADIMLDEMLTAMGYRGESVGEKLKRVVRGDFRTLDDAWEAHKIRNQIAHEGSGFALDEHEAKRVFGLYRKVFEEFYYI